MRKKLLLIATLAFLVLPVSAMATSIIEFNDTQLGWIQTASWDWTPGNALAVDSVPLNVNDGINPYTPTSFEIYYQAALGNFTDSDGNAIGGTGLNLDYEVTVVSAFGELGYRDAGTIISNANFSLDPNATINYFQVFYDTNRNSSNLTGTGFNDGTLIMSGGVIASDGSFTVLVDVNPDGNPDLSALDQFGPNNYTDPNLLTLTGFGTTTLVGLVEEADIDTSYIDANGPVNFFMNLFFNTTTTTPFLQQNPSEQFVDNTDPNAPVYFDPVYGGLDGNLNGLPGVNGPVDFHFQADGNMSFQVVPEPSTIILLGLGLLGLGGLGIVRRKRQ